MPGLLHLWDAQNVGLTLVGQCWGLAAGARPVGPVECQVREIACFPDRDCALALIAEKLD